MSSAALASIKRQYFLAYAVLGSLSPFLAVFLQQKGLGNPEIGLAIGVSSVSVLLMPVLLSYLADSRLDSRHIMAASFGVSGLGVVGLHFSPSFWPVMLFLCLHSFGYAAVFPLLDALTFAAQQENSDANRKTTPYHLIRVWGSIGFIVPGVGLFFLLRRGAAFDVVLLSTLACCGLSAINSLRLPAPDSSAATEDNAVRERLSSSLPTADAARAMRRAPVLIFCLSLFLAGVANAAFYTFFPLYLTDVVGLAKAWIAPISNVAVVFEIFFMLGFQWLLGRFGLKRLLMLGMVCLVLRLGALALFPIPAVVVGTQLVHGLIVVALFVAPVIYLNQQAGATFRNSIQGLYTMTVSGTSRILGSFIAGYIAKESLPLLFVSSAALTLVAAALLLFAFHDQLTPNAA